MRFKIDLYNSCYAPFGLFFSRRRWLGSYWDLVQNFETHEKAKEHYDKLKDLPEYLP